MKILGGILKGRRLRFRPARDLRPTPDKVRAAVMNALAEVLPGARVLDLFGGTGALGLEALSRGAAHAVFVEIEPGRAGGIRSSARELGISESVTVYADEVIRRLERLCREGKRFDLVFADPPYDRGWERKLLDAIGRCPVLGSSGWLVLESGKKTRMPGDVSCPSLVSVKTYGDTQIAFYRGRRPLSR